MCICIHKRNIFNKNKKMRAGQNSREIERDTEYPRAGLFSIFLFYFSPLCGSASSRACVSYVLK